MRTYLNLTNKTISRSYHTSIDITVIIICTECTPIVLNNVLQFLNDKAYETIVLLNSGTTYIIFDSIDTPEAAKTTNVYNNYLQI